MNPLCPFCGVEVEAFTLKATGGDMIRLRCTNPECECRPSGKPHLTFGEAVAAWKGGK